MTETLIPVIFIIVTIAFVAIAAYAIKLNDSFDALNNSQKSMHTILRETQTESRSNTDAIMVTRDKLADAIKKLEEIEALIASLNLAKEQIRQQVKKTPP
jgi:TolA-binding protein